MALVDQQKHVGANLKSRVRKAFQLTTPALKPALGYLEAEEAGSAQTLTSSDASTIVPRDAMADRHCARGAARGSRRRPAGRSVNSLTDRPILKSPRLSFAAPQGADKMKDTQCTQSSRRAASSTV
jgi:hypothetical protein